MAKRLDKYKYLDIIYDEFKFRVDKLWDHAYKYFILIILTIFFPYFTIFSGITLDKQKCIELETILPIIISIEGLIAFILLRSEGERVSLIHSVYRQEMKNAGFFKQIDEKTPFYIKFSISKIIPFLIILIAISGSIVPYILKYFYVESELLVTICLVLGILILIIIFILEIRLFRNIFKKKRVKIK